MWASVMLVISQILVFTTGLLLSPRTLRLHLALFVLVLFISRTKRPVLQELIEPLLEDLLLLVQFGSSLLELLHALVHLVKWSACCKTSLLDCLIVVFLSTVDVFFNRRRVLCDVDRQEDRLRSTQNSKANELCDRCDALESWVTKVLHPVEGVVVGVVVIHGVLLPISSISDVR